jgi:hypothetical protein
MTTPICSTAGRASLVPASSAPPGSSQTLAEAARRGFAFASITSLALPANRRLWASLRKAQQIVLSRFVWPGPRNLLNRWNLKERFV